MYFIANVVVLALWMGLGAVNSQLYGYTGSSFFKPSGKLDHITTDRFLPTQSIVRPSYGSSYGQIGNAYRNSETGYSSYVAPTTYKSASYNYELPAGYRAASYNPYESLSASNSPSFSFNEASGLKSSSYQYPYYSMAAYDTTRDSRGPSNLPSTSKSTPYNIYETSMGPYATFENPTAYQSADEEKSSSATLQGTPRPYRSSSGARTPCSRSTRQVMAPFADVLSSWMTGPERFLANYFSPRFYDNPQMRSPHYENDQAHPAMEDSMRSADVSNPNLHQFYYSPNGGSSLRTVDLLNGALPGAFSDVNHLGYNPIQYSPYSSISPMAIPNAYSPTGTYS